MAGKAAAADLAAARRLRAAELSAELEEARADLAHDGLQAALDAVAEAEAQAVGAVWRRIRRRAREYVPLRTWLGAAWYSLLNGDRHARLVAAATAALQRAAVERRVAEARVAASLSFRAMRGLLVRWRTAGLRAVFHGWRAHAAAERKARQSGSVFGGGGAAAAHLHIIN